MGPSLLLRCLVAGWLFAADRLLPLINTRDIPGVEAKLLGAFGVSLLGLFLLQALLPNIVGDGFVHTVLSALCFLAWYRLGQRHRRINPAVFPRRVARTFIACAGIVCVCVSVFYSVLSGLHWYNPNRWR